MSAADEADLVDSYIAEGAEPWPADGDLAPLDIDSRKNASRELRRLARLDAEAAEVRAVYDDRKAALDAYLADRMSGITSRREWIAGGLERFMRAEAERSGIKSLALPDGTLKLRKALQRVDGVPDQVSEDWQPFLVRFKPEIDRQEVKRLLTAGPVLGDERADGTVWRVAVSPGGEVVAGVWFVEDDAPSFKVTLNRGDDEGDE